ncbi:MAG: DUF6057 family protein [Thermoguttaceae bacterium]
MSEKKRGGRDKSSRLGALLTFLCYWFYWGGLYGDFFYCAQDSGLFFWDSDFFWNRVTRPGGMILYCASFLAQFFYYPFLGGAILALIMTFIRAAARALFAPADPRRRFVARVLAAALPLIATLASTWRGYSVFSPFEPDAPFIFPVGILATLLVLLGWRKVVARFHSATSRVKIMIPTMACLYPLMGFWGVLATMLCLFFEFFMLLSIPAPDRYLVQIDETLMDALPKRRKRRGDKDDATVRIIPKAEKKKARKPLPESPDLKERAVAGKAKRAVARGILEAECLAALCVPLGWYYFAFYRRTTLDSILWRGVTEPCFDLKDAWMQFSWNIAIAAAVFVLFLGIALSRHVPVTKRETRDFFNFDEEDEETKKRAKSKGKSKARRAAAIKLRRLYKPRAKAVVETVAVASAIFLGCYGDQNFRILCRVGREMETENWEELEGLCNEATRPTGAIVAARVLALTRLRALPDRLFARPVDGLDVATSKGMDESTALTEYFALYHGLANLATQAATYDLVQTDDRNARCLRILSRSALANGETELARRYAATLERGLFHRGFAREVYRAADAIDAGEWDATELTRSAAALRALRPKQDRVASGYPFFPLLIGVATDDWDVAEGPALDAKLSALLIERKLSEFATRLEEARAAGKIAFEGRSAPRAYQEALLVAEKIGAAVPGKLDAGIDSAKREAFAKVDLTLFRDISATGRDALRERNDGSYWYYYYDPTTNAARRVVGKGL